jgi:hypothetical protein
MIGSPASAAAQASSRAVRLGPPGPARDLDAGGVEDEVVNAPLPQQAVKPEAVEARLEAGHDRPAASELRLHPVNQAADQREKRLRVAGRDGEAADLVGSRQVGSDHPGLVAQFDGHVDDRLRRIDRNGVAHVLRLPALPVSHGGTSPWRRRS